MLPNGNRRTIKDHSPRRIGSPASALGQSVPSIGTAQVSAFASAIAGRYLGRGSSWTTLDTVWRRVPPALVISPVTRRIDLHVTPRVSIQTFAPLQTRDVRRSVQGAVQMTTLPPADGRDLDIEGESPLPTTAIRSQIDPLHLRHEVMSVMQRLLEREQRIDATTQRSARRSATDPALALPPVAAQVTEPREQQQATIQVLTRPQPAPSHAENGPVPPPSSGESLPLATRGQDRSLNTGSHAQQAVSIDLTDLTDRVVQAIDRRVIAQRERMGRW